MDHKQRILIIEDDPGTLNLLNQVVMRTGYQPILAQGGREGLRLLHAGVDLVLLDIMMRDIDGWTILETIKADPRLKPVPVIIVSAKSPSEHPAKMDALAGMYEYYFIKPFDIGALIAKISEVLNSGSFPGEYC